MTSDAKIGLILGLVFIFIIAFIINGLPKLRGETDSNELTTNMVRNEAPGVGALERRVDNQIFERPQLGQDRPVLDFGRDRPSFGPSGPEPAEGGVIRDEYVLPDFTTFDLQKALAEQARTAQQDELIGPVLIRDAGRPTVGPTATKVPGPARPENAAAPADRARAGQPKSYVVQRGDNLGLIAKNFYGAEQGNRRVNVQRIFEANRKVLASEDMVYEGQTIVIPALPAADRGKGESVLPGGLFERVSSIGRRGPAAAAPKEQPGRYYEVKDGDSLWRIAEAQLGSGVRYKEISKLNSGVLASEDDLSIGMRLRLPVN